jgi:serine/threonine-protein kinase
MLGPAGFSKLVAIKCLHAQFALEPDFVAMFLDEARLTSSIHHPNVVAALDVVSEQGELLVIMEYIHGESLAALLRASRQTGDLPPLPVVTRFVCDALEGLHAAHVASLAGRSLNIVHRDVSPQNIMVGADGNSRVLDFGIAQAAIRSRVTASGTVKGKVAYMSPEQLQNRGVDARTDIFAAGIVLWEALTGKRLFAAPDSRETVSRLLHSTILPPSAIVPALPSEIDQVALKALARDPEQRFQSAHEFAEALRRATTEGSRRAVSDWVGRVAKDSLARRLALLESLEASAIHAQASAVQAQDHAGLTVVIGSPKVDVPSHAIEGTDTQVPSTRTILAVQRTGLVARWGPFAAAVGGIVAVMVAWATVATHPAALAALPTPVKSPSAVVPLVERGAAPSSGPAAFQVESLPLAVASGEPEKRTASKSRLSAAIDPAPEPTNRRQPMNPAGSTNRPELSLPPEARPIAALETHPEPTRMSCSPPYRIDAAGVRRVKRECL